LQESAKHWMNNSSVQQWLVEACVVNMQLAYSKASGTIRPVKNRKKRSL
jgi:hypothetical protein